MVQKSVEIDPLIDKLPSRYVVGVDLGTTNSAVSFIDTANKSKEIKIFSIPQHIGPVEIENRDVLPSFHYQPTSSEIKNGTTKLPWKTDDQHYTVGTFARDVGGKTSGRVISSAKSWLSHSGVDRTADLLPWQGAEDVDRLSPIEVSARYLRHIRQAWDDNFRNEPLAEQDIVITLPASFDEVARELTVQAATVAGLPRIILIEEPQAAFYAWVHKHQDSWDTKVSPGQKILVCDIGGGTTDFTLIRVRKSESASNEAGDGTDGDIQFHRVAVGDHLILGGDNLDLALAKYVEPKIAQGQKLSPQKWDMLLNRCRRAKEQLLVDHAPERVTINLPGSGSKLIGGGIKTEVTREEVQKLLIDGFLPDVSLNEKPARQQSGFQEFGLPYASDAAISKYLAAFLLAHQDSEPNADETIAHRTRPDAILFNGGFFASPQLRGKLIGIVSSWFSSNNEAWTPEILDNDRLDLAVARGAAYYGMVRRGEGVRIVASLARSYYITVQNENNESVAVCLVPGNAEPGQDVLLDRRFLLSISQPVEFPLLVSSVRLTDQPGDIVPIDMERMRAMPPIRTVLKTKKRSETGELAVHLFVKLTEIGTIDLWCQEIDSDRSWKLQFDIRSATQTDIDAHDSIGEAEGVLDESIWHECQQTLRSVFAVDADEKPGGLVKRLSKVLDASRTEWPMPLLRRIWDALMELEPGRRKSAAHENRWLNLLGFSLRPGYGIAVDDWRVSETWRHVRGKLVHRSPNIQAESLILWRRVSGGLSSGQQLAIAEPYLATVRSIHRQSMTGKSASAVMKPEDTAELWRLLGSLELLAITIKIELGNMIADLLPKKRFEKVRESMVWALGRLGQRVPIYGPLNTIVSPEVAAKWIVAVQQQKKTSPVDQLAIMQLARKSDDRYRDITDSARRQVIDWLESHKANQHILHRIQEAGSLDDEQQGFVFGESLPTGLRIQ